jgi:hypothetical protein
MGFADNRERVGGRPQWVGAFMEIEILGQDGGGKMPILCTFFNEGLENGELGIDARGLSSTDCRE